MGRLFVVLLTLVATSLFAQRGAAPPPPPPPLTQEQVLVPGQNITIVSGTGSVAMAPDVVTVRLGVESDGEHVPTIVATNNTRVAEIIRQLKARGVKPQELQTSAFYVRSLERGDVRVGYLVSNTITLSSSDVARVGELVEAAINSGANEVSGPNFSVQNEKVVQDQCLDLAFADAKSKAARLARLSERKLGKVLAVTDGSSSPFELEHTSGVMGGVLGGVVMEAGVHRVSCGVTVAFQLE
jgi:uncharacterized protein YggE